MQKLSIFTENFFVFPRFKNIFKAVLGDKNRGPSGVFASLIHGLQGLGKDFVLNKKIENFTEAACVLSGIKTLEWAIRRKQEGRIKKIIAGPNLVVSPNDHNRIITSPEIDKIIVPSNWVKEYYLKVAPEILSKIFIWAAGVDVPDLSRKERDIDFLVYNKIGKTKLFFDIVSYLKQSNFKYEVINYGKHKQKEYFTLLGKCKKLIYLSSSESQGLSMFEAWARNVPTLVWDKGFFEYESTRVEGNMTSPYLSAEAGDRFKNMQEFKQKLQEFVFTSFQPREYIMNNFTNKQSAKKYLEIVNG